MKRNAINKRFSRGNSYRNNNSRKFSRRKISASHSDSKANDQELKSGSMGTNADEITQIKKFIVTGSKLLREKGPTIPYLIESLFQQTGVVSIVGGSDTGKSSFLRQLATAIVHGDVDFLGFKINAQHKRVIYVSTEDDDINMSHLLAKQNINNLPEERYENIGFIFETQNIIEKIGLTLKNFPADCVIIDAFADLFPGNMNDVTQVRNYLQQFSSLAVVHKCLFIFLHHTSKRSEELNPSKNNAIGSQGFEGKMRLMIELRKDFSDPTIRHMCLVKGNYQPEENKTSSYVLKFENMRFSNLNRRVAFDQLGKPEVARNMAKEKAIEYRRQGHSINVVLEMLNADGYTPARSTVHNWIRDVDSSQALYGFESDEPETESEE